MLYSKFHDHWTISSVEKDFRFLGRGGHLVLVTWNMYIYIFFLSAFPRRLHIKFGFDRLSYLREDL